MQEYKQFVRIVTNPSFFLSCCIISNYNAVIGGYCMKFNALVPELSVSNIQKSLDFYVKVLKFKIEYERPQDKFAFLSYGEAQLMIEQHNAHWNVAELIYPFGRGVNFQIETSDIKQVQSSLQEHNIQPFKDVFVSSYIAGNQTFKELEILVLDPDGYLLRFSQGIE